MAIIEGSIRAANFSACGYNSWNMGGVLMRVAILPCLLIFQLPAIAQDGETIKKKQGEIQSFLKTAKTEREIRAALADLTKLAATAYEINEYDLSVRLYADAERVARAGVKDVVLAQSLAEAGKRSAEVGRAFKKAERSYYRIEAKEGTPEDYTEVGKFIAFVKGGWDIGLKYLADGKDETLKQLATEDLFGGASAQERVGIGDRWLEVGRKESAAKHRAVHNYAKAWSGLSGIEKEKVRGKIASVLKRGASKGPPKMPTGWTMGGDVRVKVDETYAHQGRNSLLLMPGPVPAPPLMLPHGAAPEGQKAKLSMWVLTDGTNKEINVFSVRFTGPDGKDVVVRLPAPVDKPWWNYVEQTIEFPVGASKLYIGGGGGGVPDVGNIWVDDVSLRTEGGVELIVGGGFEG